MKKWLAWGLGAFALAAVALVAAALVLVDAPAVRAELQRRLSEALQGSVTWEALEIGLLPAPRAELRQVRVEIPDKLSATADDLQVRLRLWPLLRGSVEISSVTAARPRVRITPATEGGSDAPLDAVALYRAAIEPAARALQDFAPDMTLKLEQASVDIGADFALRDLRASARTGAKGVDLQLAAASSFWKRLSIDGRIEYADLSARADISLDALAVDRDVPPANLRAKLSTDAKSAIECDFNIDLAPVGQAQGKAVLPAGKAPQIDAQLSNVDLAQTLAIVRRKVAGLDALESVGGTLSARASATLDSAWQAHLDIVKSDAAIKLAALPTPVLLTAGSLQAGPRELRFARLQVAMMDARTQVSGSFAFKSSALELALAEGVVGEKLVRWAMELGAAPARLEPKTPLRVVASRIAWAPKRALELDARIDFPNGPAAGVVLAWRPEQTELKRVTIKDAGSDARFGATIAGELIRASFSGTLRGRSIAAMLRQPPPSDSGVAQGALRVTIDRKQPSRTLAEGKLRIEALDLSWLAGKKALIERAEISADRAGARISSARFGWEDQFFELSGSGRRTDAGPVVDARLESAGVMLDRLLPQVDPKAPKKKASPIWPLPVTGRVELSTGFVQYKEYRIEPFAGILSLEPERARLEVKQARMCGLSFPMEVEAHPTQTLAAAHIVMKNEPLERTVQCLTGGSVQLTGNADLSAELRVQGQRPHLLRSLTGTAQARVTDGRVRRFALLGNILSFRGIAAVSEKEEGFPYRSMTAKGRFESGQFHVEEAFFDSDAVRLAANGNVDLLGANSHLTVLVGLLARVDRVAGAIPIIGDVFGGSMTALPISVIGDIRDPLIVPLGPHAVSDRLLGIFERTLKLPGKLLVPPEAKPAP